MNCQEIPILKQYLISKFDTSPTLKQAISSTRADFKSDDIPSIYSLIDINVFDYRYPRTLENEQKTIISITTPLTANPTIRNGMVYIYIYTHVDLMKTVYGLNRNDYIICRIEEIINDSNAKGIVGEISFVNTQELSPIGDYVVSCISYKFANLNFPFVETVESYE